MFCVVNFYYFECKFNGCIFLKKTVYKEYLNNKGKIMLRISAFLSVLLMSFKAMANCPVCMVTVGASLYLAEKTGLDKCVIGVWSGALLAIVGYFLIRWFNKKNWIFKGYQNILMGLSIASIGLMYIPGIPGGMIYEPMIIGFLYIDSFLLSNIIGAFVFIFGVNLYAWMKEKNGGHAHFPFEKVVVPVVLVSLISALFYFYPLCDCATKTNMTEDILPLSE